MGTGKESSVKCQSNIQLVLLIANRRHSQDRDRQIIMNWEGIFDLVSKRSRVKNISASSRVRSCAKLALSPIFICIAVVSK